MNPYVLGFRDIDKTQVLVVGGKGANLGELASIEGLNVPDGFCISTAAFKRITGEASSLNELLAQLALLKVEDRDKIAELSGEIRRVIEAIAIPQGIVEEITRYLFMLGEEEAYAVRSSATAEDLPTASFAGQQDTYLNVIGKEAILRQVSKCWASLFTERAVVYRLQNGFDHRKVHPSVVVQRMVFPQAAGIVFTADPVTSNRKVLAIVACFGLGEAAVSGLVNADTYKVRNGQIIEKKIGTKQLAIYAAKYGGTKVQEIEPERQNRQALTDEQVLQLERLGRKIEEHFGRPQDIEWCLVEDAFYFVQSRPITTLFPIPQANDQENHVYVSVGHQQMMTVPLKPLGLSFFLLTTRAPMRTAGGRLFVDVTQMLAAPDSRRTLLNTMGEHDPLMKDALKTVVERGDFVEPLANDNKARNPGISNKGASFASTPAQGELEPAIVSDLVRSNRASIEKLKQNIQLKSGLDLLDFILEDIQELKKILFDAQSMRVIVAAMAASAWVNEKVNEWLGAKNVADALAQSVPNNITAEMGLDLLDVADAIRPYPEVIEYLRQVRDDDSLAELDKLAGGRAAHDAIYAYLDKYGMRCVGEIDITRTRWSERPQTLVPLILSNIKNFAPHGSQRKFEQGDRRL